ncbi:MAG: hypothetical protein NC084_03505 [Bacteroides sp.]|nr:hypothetical protein [Eubacterium sp.]MCM1419049.1 hypothetical protein [Roseburia sp.]MCM1461764.1 hypothetical protein [Bacteroides sp.]
MSDLISLLCPQCNARLELRENEATARCPYCETEILVKEAMTAKSITAVAESVDRLGDSVKGSIRAETRDANEEARRLSIYNLLCLYEHCFQDYRFEDFENHGQELMKLDSSEDFYELKKDLERFAFLCQHPIFVSEVLIFAVKMFGICFVATVVLLLFLGSIPVLNCVPLLLLLVPVAYVVVRLKQRKDDKEMTVFLCNRIEDRFSALKERFSPNKAAG